MITHFKKEEPVADRASARHLGMVLGNWLARELKLHPEDRDLQQIHQKLWEIASQLGGRPS